MEKLFKNILYVVFSIFLIFIAVYTFMGGFSKDSFTVYTQNQEEMRTITVSGEASDFVKPDMASITLTVESEGETVDEVSVENNKKMSQIVSAMKDLGISDNDIKTTQYNLRPRYDYDRSPARIVGYTLSQNLSVKIRDLDNVEEVISQATENGANRMSGLTFMVDDKDQYIKDIREAAVAEAKVKASEIEETVGIELGEIIGYRELGNQNNPPIYYEAAMDMVGSRKEMSIESGSQEIVSRIELIYEIK